MAEIIRKAEVCKCGRVKTKRNRLCYNKFDFYQTDMEVMKINSILEMKIVLYLFIFLLVIHLFIYFFLKGIATPNINPMISFLVFSIRYNYDEIKYSHTNLLINKSFYVSIAGWMFSLFEINKSVYQWAEFKFG